MKSEAYERERKQVEEKKESSDSTKVSDTQKSNFTFDDAYNKNHLVKGDGIGAKKKGVIGAHNREGFINTLNANGFDEKECIIKETPHSKIKGISEIEYKLPKKTGEGKIIIPKEFKSIDTPKTVYDPNIISDEQIIEWGKEAMRNGTIDGMPDYSQNNTIFH